MIYSKAKILKEQAFPVFLEQSRKILQTKNLKIYKDSNFSPQTKFFDLD